MDFLVPHNLMENALDEGLFTGAVLEVRSRGTVVFSEAYGTLGGPDTPAATQQTLFDLASLTKVIATTPSWLLICADIPGILDRPISHWFPETPTDKARITPRHLLAHASGLPAWRPYYLTRFAGGAPGDICPRILAEPLDYPVGQGCVYSDLGFILLSKIIELETGYTLDGLCRERIYTPLGLEKDLLFIPKEGDIRIALTRQGDAAGLVNDLNARALGGASGHAGLFGTATAVSSVATRILESFRSPGGFFPRDLTREYCTRADFVPGSSRALGFDTPSEQGSSSGTLFSPDSIGHTGFTGTSVWIDLEAEITVVLLTNRVIMGEADQRIKAFRPVLHDAVRKALETQYIGL